MSGKEQEEHTPIQNLAAKTVNAFHSTPHPPLSHPVPRINNE